MRRDLLYLRDILDAADSITRFLDGVDEDAFRASDLIQSAVLQKLMIVGEAAAHMGTDLKGKYPHVPWKPIIGFRDIVVHSYFRVSWSLVWLAATEEVPALCEDVRRILAAEEAANLSESLSARPQSPPEAEGGNT